MENHKINVRLRLVVIKNEKVLVQYRQKHDYYHYFGGHLEYGETILEGCIRETVEECNGAKFEFKKILYIRDFLFPEKENEHSVELFILGDIDKFEELEHWLDPQHPDGDVWCTWLDINNLPDNLFPHALSKKLLEDYKAGFPREGEYVGRMDK
ncbi:MAG TPA: NUDIX domain-containing protein [Candidatus Woesebacteria bacterium]|nr:NUDIX domain-containing protein [Candidatus Woesebacteria bacterium]